MPQDATDGQRVADLHPEQLYALVKRAVLWGNVGAWIFGGFILMTIAFGCLVLLMVIGGSVG